MPDNSQVSYFPRAGMLFLGDAVKLEDNGLDTTCSWIEWSLEHLISLRENSLAYSFFMNCAN